MRGVASSAHPTVHPPTSPNGSSTNALRHRPQARTNLGVRLSIPARCHRKLVSTVGLPQFGQGGGSVRRHADFKVAQGQMRRRPL